MFKKLFFYPIFLFAIGHAGLAQKAKQGKAPVANTDLKFLDDISFSASPSQTTVSPKSNAVTDVKKTPSVSTPAPSTDIESASALQFKYAQLMNVEVEQIKNLSLFKLIDEWFGTHYQYGGSTKAGIDCSAFMQVLFAGVYSINLPRTAREQYQFSKHISRTEMQEGDLVFFNTIGGVSHVGMYLGNNKFVHASVNGVTISDLFENYYSRRFVGVGRIQPPSSSSTAGNP